MSSPLNSKSSFPSNLDVKELMSVVQSDLPLERSDAGRPRITLDNQELWRKFHQCQNEMIVTKSGRRMFPVVQLQISGIDPGAMFSLVLDFSQLSGSRWKHLNGEWVTSGKAEPPPRPALYVHPDSPNFGAYWMNSPISFSKVKLTNKSSANGQIVLNSLHKYQPTVHLIQVGNGYIDPPVVSATFAETQFIAVTAYQNDEITALKVAYNPYAKAFQDTRERSESQLSTKETQRFIPMASPSPVVSISSWHFPCHTSPTNHGTLTSSPAAIRYQRTTPYTDRSIRRTTQQNVSSFAAPCQFPPCQYDQWPLTSPSTSTPQTIPTMPDLCNFANVSSQLAHETYDVKSELLPSLESSGSCSDLVFGTL